MMSLRADGGWPSEVEVLSTSVSIKCKNVCCDPCSVCVCRPITTELLDQLRPRPQVDGQLIIMTCWSVSMGLSVSVKLVWTVMSGNHGNNIPVVRPSCLCDGSFFFLSLCSYKRERGGCFRVKDFFKNVVRQNMWLRVVLRTIKQWFPKRRAGALSVATELWRWSVIVFPSSNHVQFLLWRNRICHHRGAYCWNVL